MSADEASAVTPRRRRRHTPRSPTVLDRSARPRRLSSAGSDRPVDLAAIGGSPPRPTMGTVSRTAASGHRKRRQDEQRLPTRLFCGNRPDICPAGADSKTTSYSSPFVHRKEEKISRRGGSEMPSTCSSRRSPKRRPLYTHARRTRRVKEVRSRFARSPTRSRGTAARDLPMRRPHTRAASLRF